MPKEYAQILEERVQALEAVVGTKKLYHPKAPVSLELMRERMMELDKIAQCLIENLDGFRECLKKFDETHKPEKEDPQRKEFEETYRYTEGYRPSLAEYRRSMKRVRR
jgi:hypothetical protein